MWDGDPSENWTTTNSGGLFTNWRTNEDDDFYVTSEPNDWFGVEDCAAIGNPQTNFVDKWNDWNCDLTSPSGTDISCLCSVSAPTSICAGGEVYLQVLVSSATLLKSGACADNSPDSYVQITVDGFALRTSTILDDRTPLWAEVLDFGCVSSLAPGLDFLVFDAEDSEYCFSFTDNNWLLETENRQSITTIVNGEDLTYMKFFFAACS